MAKSVSSAPVQTGSIPPRGVASRHAAPERWDKPFSADMQEVDVDLLLAHPLFVATDPRRFPASIPLRGILKNDARVRRFQRGEIIVRQGDYGHSAFVILDGAVRVLLKEPTAEQLGHRRQVRPSVWGSLARWWRRPRFAEQAGNRGAAAELELTRDGEARIFLQDVPGVLAPDRTALLGTGEMFGEIAALGRTPRTATIVADQETQMLEIRWQGLREIRKYSPEWKQQIDRLYRERSLRRHLAETALFWNLSDEVLGRIADATRFETFGEFDWHHAYHRGREAGERERLEQEPLMAREGDYPNGLLLVRSGFARVSRRYNHGERTESYRAHRELPRQGRGLRPRRTHLRLAGKIPAAAPQPARTRLCGHAVHPHRRAGGARLPPAHAGPARHADPGPGAGARRPASRPRGEQLPRVHRGPALHERPRRHADRPRPLHAVR